MKLRHAVAAGFIAGATFSLGAMLTDLMSRHNLPHHDVFMDPSQFLASLRK